MDSNEADGYSEPLVRLALFNNEGVFVGVKGNGLPDDRERFGKPWHRGRSPKGKVELQVQALMNKGEPFEMETSLGAHPMTGLTVNLYMRGQPVLHPNSGVRLGFQVLSILRQPAGEGAVSANDFTHIREVWLWNTARTHLAYLERKHPYTALHGVMVGVYARAFAEVLSPLLMSGLNVEIKQDEHGRGYRSRGFTREELYELLIAGQLHDCGKTLVGLDVLDSPGRLDDTQMAHMRGHLSDVAVVILNLFNTMLACRAIESHHSYEFVDSSENEWPFAGRMMAVADVFDAIASKRTYREGEGTGPVNALNLLLKDTTTPIAPGNRVMKMDPVLVGVFLKNFPEINKRAMGHLAEEIEYRRLELAKVSGRLRLAEEGGASPIRLKSLAELRRIFSASKAALDAQFELRSDWGTQVAEYFGLALREI